MNLKKLKLWALPAIALIALVFAGEASASHFRGGFVSWERVSGTTVKFKVRHAWRADSTDGVSLSFGDGIVHPYTQGTLIASLTDLSGQPYKVFEFEATHTYQSNGNWTAGFSSCCRIFGLVNGSSGSFSVYTNVNLIGGQNGSSIMSLPYILEVDNGPNDIALNPIDVDGPVTCRWATSAESGIDPPLATMTPNCHLVFDGTGKAHGTIYAGQVIMTDPSGAKTPYDMMFQVNANLANLAPICTLNGNANSTIPMGQPFSISVTGTDPEGLSLKVNHLGLPSGGATLTPVAGSTGASPMTATFNWTPVAIGQNAVTVLFQDNANQSCQKSFTLDVINPNSPPIANAGGDGNVNEGGNYTLDGSGSSDPNGDALTYTWTQLPGTTPVSLSDPNAVSPSFTAPWLANNETITFKLEVSDGTYSDIDTVDVTVTANNHPPVADAGDNSTIKEGATKTLNGALTYDPDNEPVQSYSWAQVGSGPVVTLLGGGSVNPSFTPALGLAGQSVTFQLQASDGKESSTLSSLPDANVSGDDLVTVQIVANSSPVADAGADQTKDEGNTAGLDGSASSDPDLDNIAHHWVQTGGTSVVLSDENAAKPTFTSPWVNAGGEDLTFELTVTDTDPLNPKSSKDTVVIHVTNANDPPRCDLAQPSIASFWPPNHTMQNVSIIGVSDVVGDTVSITITGATQDEPINGTGDGDTSPDASINGSNVLLRAERSGNGDGRVYNVNFTATDGKENCSGSVKVSVPHSRKTTAVDSGQTVDSTQP